MAITVSGTSITFNDATTQSTSTQVTRYYESAPLTMTAASGVLSVNHGLGVVPKIIMPSLRCAVSEYNYPVGSEIYAIGLTDAPGQGLHTWSATSTIIQWRSESNFYNRIVNFSATTFHILTLANWRLVIRAYI